MLFHLLKPFFSLKKAVKVVQGVDQHDSIRLLVVTLLLVVVGLGGEHVVDFQLNLHPKNPNIPGFLLILKRGWRIRLVDSKELISDRRFPYSFIS